MFVFATAILMTSCDKGPHELTGTPSLANEEDFRTVDNLSNYPDPFISSTTFEYRVSKHTYVNFVILNSDNERVMILERGPKKEGIHNVEFDASELPGGVYFAKLTTRDSEIFKEIIKINKSE
jgi:hypothetical protein